MVPVAGLEPARILLRGILSPLCLPIPSHRRVSYYSALRAVCQSFDGGEFVAMLYVPPRVESGSPNA